MLVSVVSRIVFLFQPCPDLKPRMSRPPRQPSITILMLELNGQRLSLQQIADVATGREHVSLSPEARRRAEESRRVVEQIVAEGARSTV